MSEIFDIERDEDSKYIYINPKKGHDTTLIFLHGVTGSAEGYFEMFLNPKMTSETTRIVLPTASVKPVTLYNGDQVTSWLDMFTLYKKRDSLEEILSDFNQDDCMASALLILNLVDLEKQKFPDQNESRIFIAGFS